MALPTWPTGVPNAPLRDSWDVDRFNANLETEMEAGNVRVRRRPWNLIVMQWSRVLNPTQMTAFETFVTTTISGGAARFAMSVSLDGSTFVTRTVQMRAKSLKYSSFAPDLTQVSFTMLVFPASVTS
ncbi:hypothetical protein [Xanthobacter tagetidis]|uniref:Uncharacterized protein n=1 Tax=Xanthobacter tagetidis TaxID=60216 RepID=A0A3L7AIK4_9HYPH|nr:hypothetical protein [Xanthobacter tagetidis]MBB6306215.1 hypothetical protein [Xanthobacter tagetidis]RLP79498.1 hypothetical protein D9R14_07485 [Xanthobacter tagetidis]